MFDQEGEKKGQDIGLAGWVILLIFFLILGYAIYNKMTAG